MKKAQIRIETYKITFTDKFAQKYIADRKIASVIEAGEGYAIGFFHKESDIPLQLRDEILEVKHNDSNGYHLSGGMFAKAHGEGITDYTEIKIGANQDLFFQLKQ